MKIVIAHNWSDEGISAQSKKLAEHLSLKHQVIFFSHTSIGASFLKISSNLSIYNWKGKRPTTWADFKLLFQVLRNFRPNVVIGHFGASTLLAITAWLLRVPSRIETYHTVYLPLVLDSKQPFWRFWLQVKRKSLLYRLNTQIFPITEFGINDLNRYYKVPKSMCHAMPNGLPDQPLRNNYTHLTQLRFLGRLDMCKGVDILVEAVALVVEQIPAIKLEIAGSGPQLENLQQTVQQKGLTQVVQFVGKIPYHKVAEFLSNATWLIIPSRMDNHPTVIMEAFSCGTPVIGANNGGIPEMICNGVDGFIYKKDSPHELANTILMALATADCRKMGVAARGKFETKYHIDRYIDRMETKILQLTTQ
ncbi:MAG TPA: glycosyltransferase family 4 protein [Phnomibacter sp.]|nr:glycosyltransferase family 4 protein [Phnomibacter sp.]